MRYDLINFLIQQDLNNGLASIVRTKIRNKSPLSGNITKLRFVMRATARKQSFLAHKGISFPYEALLSLRIRKTLWKLIN